MNRRFIKKGSEVKVTAQFLEAIHKVILHFEGNYEKARLWLIFGNANLGGYAPLQLIALGRAEKVLKFIDSAKSENKEAEHEQRKEV